MLTNRAIPFILPMLCFLALTPCHVSATSVTGGRMVVDFDAAALASMNFGSDPDVPAMYVEEFFGGQADATRTRDQILYDEIVPGNGAIPATGLVFEFNGPTVTNLTRRYSQPTVFSFQPQDLTGTASGGIGMRGVMRMRGDFEGLLLIGDLLLRYDPARKDPDGLRSGWVLWNYLDYFKVPVFDTRNVSTTVKPGRLTLTGTVTISEQFANAFLYGEQNKPVGTFTLTAHLPGADFLGIETVPVGNAGNAPDLTGYGRVDYDYHIGKTEVTNAQYAYFLNAVDPDGTNPHDVYNSNMSSDITVTRGGIDFFPGSPAGNKYRPKPRYGNKPVSYVSFYDAARFTNWLMTGETERGFYTLTDNVTITAEGPHGPAFGKPWVALPNEDEWYKAAYHKNDGMTGNYWLYPTAGNDPPTVALSNEDGDISNPGPNVANYDFGAVWNGAEGLGNVTTVGSAGPYSASPYGTLDQGGNQYEWNDTLIGLNRGFRGGSLWRPLDAMKSTTRGEYYPETGGSSLAFRIASSGPLARSGAVLNGFHVAAGGDGLPVLRFTSEAAMEYQFEYSTDLTHWHRLYVPLTGDGSVQEIPVPAAVRSGGKCIVRAILTWIESD
jgi:sulfatase modifying factor 1